MNWDTLCTRYKNERTEFDKLVKNLSRTSTRSTSKETFDANLDKFIERYNNILRILNEKIPEQTESQSEKIQASLFSVRDKTVKLFSLLKLKIVVPTNFGVIDKSVLEERTDSETEDMPLSPEEFYSLATKGIRSYSGDPLSLTAFINSLNLMEKMAGETHKDLLVSIIMTKLEGNAFDAVNPDSKSVKEITTSLKNEIKPESSKVLGARLLSLRFDRSKVQDFCKEADELAENLKRSLVLEGITGGKASEMVIDKTIEMCRSCTRSDLVKAVLAATTYHDHKEVVAKLVLEASTEVKEKQVLAYRAQGKYKKNRGRGRGQYGNQYSQQRGNNHRQQGYNKTFYNSNRGRGRGRGGYNNNDRSVRVIEASGNSEVPQHYQLGGPSDNTSLVPYQR